MRSGSKRNDTIDVDQEYTWFSENSFVTKGAQRKTLLQTESIQGSRSLSSENAWNSKWIPATAQQSKGKGILGDLLWHHSFPASKIENSNLEYSKYQTISMFFMKDMRYYPSFFVLILLLIFTSWSTHNLYVYFFYILLLVLRDTFMASKYRYYDFLQRSHNGMHVISDSFTRSWVVKHFLFSLLLFSSRRPQHLALGREGTSNNSCLVDWWTSW